MLCLGCRSIYQETLPALGASPEERFELRLEEARRMRERADRAAARVESRLRKGEPASEWGSEIDRLQVATMDLGRALATADDAFPADPPPQAQLEEMKQLQERLAQVRHLLARARPPSPPEPSAP